MAAAGVIDAFTLPAHLEAAEPPEARGLRRDDVRLLVSHVDTDSIAHARFSDLPRWLAPGDLLVVNTSGTLNAALTARPGDGERFELHLSTRLPGNFWAVEVRRPGPVASLPYRHARAGTHVRAGGRRPRHAARAVSARRRAGSAVAVVDRGAATRRTRAARISNGSAARFDTATSRGRGRTRCIRRSSPPNRAARRCHRPGGRSRRSSSRGSSPPAFRSRRCCCTPASPASRITNRPYEEFFRVPPETAERVNAARRAGHRVVAVGTTVVRALETVTDSRGTTSPGEGWTNLVITPERPLRAVNGMITGLPRTARHASRDVAAGDRRRRRRRDRRRTSSAPTTRRSRPDTCGTSSATRI